MVVQPSIEAHEALINEVKALKEELKRVRNEKKDTSRSSLEVGLRDRKTRDRKASRNSWADIYNEATVLHKHKKLLGQEVETDDGLEWRVKWGQRGAGMFMLLGAICFVAEQFIVAIVFGALFLIFLGMLYYKNVSFVIIKRLLREPNVVIIVVLALCNWSIDIARPNHSLSPVTGLVYVLGSSGFALADALKVKSRAFVIGTGIMFVLLNVRNIYVNTFTDVNQGIILLKYTIQGNEHTFMKRSVKRSIYIQIVLFSMNGIYTLFKDRKQELMIFATGNIYRETGTASNDVEDKQYSEKIKSEKRILSKKVELQVVRNEKKETSRSPLEVELQPKTRDRKASRNSWAEIYNETTALRKHKRLLGQEVETDEWLEFRIKWAQRGAGVCGLLGLIFYVAGQWIAVIVFITLALIFVGILYYKNFSFIIAKRLLRETNVVIILVFGLCIAVINIAKPAHSLESLIGLLYMLGVAMIIFIDAIKVKSRVFVMVVGILFVLINVSGIYRRIFTDSDQGVVLLKYTINGSVYTFMKRSVKRSVFIQVMLFSMNGIYTLFKDRKQELMVFATGNIYRETGTASMEVKDKTIFDVKIKSEKSISV